MILISPEFPFPPNHGAKIDTFRKLEAFKREGVEVCLICWASQPPSQPDLDAVLKVCAEVEVLPYPSGALRKLRRLIELKKYPLHMSSRPPDPKGVARAGNFKADLVFLDGLYGYRMGKEISRRTGAPLVFRSHNIEHQYEEKLMKLAHGKSKFLKHLQTRGLKEIEFEIFENARRVYDISYEDSLYWQGQGFQNVINIPPLISTVTQPAQTKKDFDCAFVGNLRTANNVDGVVWFLKEVWPELKLRKSNLKICIAGSEPVDEIKELCLNTQGVTFVPNAPSASAVYLSARCLINPIRAGSGVQLKSIEMLPLCIPIVTHPQGVRGLPLAAREFFDLATTKEEFVACVLEAVEKTMGEDRCQRQLDACNRLFGESQGKAWVDDLRKFANKGGN